MTRLTFGQEWPFTDTSSFFRVIFDTVIGVDAPWAQKIKRPGCKTMSIQQLRGCVKLGRDILDGKADLVLLNNSSLAIRGRLHRGDHKTPRHGTRGNEVRLCDSAVTKMPQEEDDVAASSANELQRLREYFKLMIQEFLPKAAAAKSPAQVRPILL